MGLAEKKNSQAFEAEASPDRAGSSTTRTAPRFVLNRGKGTGSLYPHVERLLDTGRHGNRGKAAHFGRGQSLERAPLQGQQPGLPTAGDSCLGPEGRIWAGYHRQHPPRPVLLPLAFTFFD